MLLLCYVQTDTNWGMVFPQYIDVMARYFGMTELAVEYLQDGSLSLYLTNLANRMPANGMINYPGTEGDWVPPYPVCCLVFDVMWLLIIMLCTHVIIHRLIRQIYHLLRHLGTFKQ